MSRLLRVFDISLLPSFEYQSLFTRLDKDVDEGLQRISSLQEVYDRARAALMFFYQTNPENDAWRNEARLRAGLNELYSMEGAANRGFKNASLGLSAPKLSESKNLLLHMMYILRHLNVHTTPLPSVVDEITVIVRPTTSPEEMTFGAVMLSEITIADLLRRSKEMKKYYNRADIEAGCAWLMEKQRAFGIAEVFSRGVNAYCRELLSKYGPDNPSVEARPHVER